MWGIIKKSCDSLINPLCFNLIMAAFANTVPIFLFVESIIDFNYFIYFLAAELFFWIVFVHYLILDCSCLNDLLFLKMLGGWELFHG